MRKEEKHQERRGFLAAVLVFLGGFFSGEWWRSRRGVSRWRVPSEPGRIRRKPGDLHTGYDFVEGEQVTTEKLNALIEDSVLKPEAISRRPAFTASDGTEETLVQKDGALWKMPISATRKMLVTIDVRDHGAVGDGIDDDAPAINSAIIAAGKAGGGQVVFPAGAFRCDRRIDLANGVYLQGAGVGATLLDFTAATVGMAFVYGRGDLMRLPPLAAGVEAGDRLLSFSADHGLAVGDVIFITDMRPRSYDFVDPDYRQGEAVRVAKTPSSTQAVLATALYGGYEAIRNLEILKQVPIQTSVSDFSMKFRPGVTRAGIRIDFGAGLHLENLDLTGSRYTQILLHRCYETGVHKVRAVDYQDFPERLGYNYGLVVSSCQRLTVSDSFFETTRHGTATGTNATLPGAIVNREMTFVNCHIASRGDSWGMDFHTNAEHWLVSNCTLPNGITIGGDWGVVSGCTIGQDPLNNRAIANRGIVGMNFEVTNNLVLASRHYALGLIQMAFRAGFSRPGSGLRIAGNIVKSGRFHHPAGPGQFAAAIMVTATRDAPDLIEATVDVSNNQIDFDEFTKPPSAANVYGIAALASGKLLRHFVAQNNTLMRNGIRIDGNIHTSDVLNNVILEPQHHGIRFIATEDPPNSTRIVRGNTVLRSRMGGMTLHCGTQTTAIVEANTVLEPRARRTGSGDDCSCLITGAERVILRNNTFGDRSDSPGAVRGWVARNVKTLVKSGNIVLGNVPAPEVRENIGSEFGGWENEGSPRIHYATEPPTSGTWQTGDKVWNTAPQAGGYVGWVCVSGASPGIWRGFGLIQDVRR